MADSPRSSLAPSSYRDLPAERSAARPRLSERLAERRRKRESVKPDFDSPEDDYSSVDSSPPARTPAENRSGDSPDATKDNSTQQDRVARSDDNAAGENLASMPRNVVGFVAPSQPQTTPQPPPVAPPPAERISEGTADWPSLRESSPAEEGPSAEDSYALTDETADPFIIDSDDWSQVAQAEPPSDEPAAAPDETPGFERFRDEAGTELVEGTMTVRFEPGQKRANIHIPFTPPLEGKPDVECEATGDEVLRLKVPVRQSYGIRIEARRSNTDDALETEVGFSAIYNPEA